MIRLQQFEAVLVAYPGSPEHKQRLSKLAASAREKLGDLPESNVKTDLATALHLYERAAVDGNRNDDAAAAVSQCESEKPGAYQRLCETNSGPSRNLLSHKARLHLSWARAGIMFQRDGDRSDTLGEMQAERANDLALALRVIAALKVLERDVVVYTSLGDFEESPKLARVPFERFVGDLRQVSADVELMLSWLPQNKLKSMLGNALHSYQDGGVRWQKIYSPRVVNVANLAAPEIIRTPSESAYLATTPYIVAINWRQGSKYLRLAEEALERTAGASSSELIGLN